MLIIGEGCQAILLILLLFTNFYYVISLSTMLVLATCQALFSTITTPSKNALFPSLLTDKKDVLTARVTINLCNQMIQVFAYACSALIISYLGLYLCLLTAAASYQYSIYMMLLAIGSIPSAALLPKLKNIVSQEILFSIGFACAAVGLYMLYADSFSLKLIAGFLMGVSNTFVSIINATIIQTYTPEHMTARIFSVFKFCSYIAGPLGILLIGCLREIVTLKYLFLIISFGMTILAIASFCSLQPILNRQRNR